MASKIAYSLAEAVRSRAIVQVLNLKGSSDLVCENVMCAKAGQSCYCRLLVALQRLPNLKELDLSNNALKEIPEILTPEVVPGLTSLSIGGNELESLPLSVLALPNLKALHVEKNPLRGESLIAASATLQGALQLDPLQQQVLEAHKRKTELRADTV